MTNHDTSFENLTVFIVDDDPDVRDSLGLLLGLRGYRTALFACAENFLAAWRPGFAGCIIADLKMPGMSGLELQKELASKEISLPLVMLTAHGDVNSARQALREKAIDFLQKPFREEELTAAIDTAFRQDLERLKSDQVRSTVESGLAALTQREREVMFQLATGASNIAIAQSLSISPRTVEVHKARVMEKLEVSNLVELTRIADRAGKVA